VSSSTKASPAAVVVVPLKIRGTHKFVKKKNLLMRYVYFVVFFVPFEKMHPRGFKRELQIGQALFFSLFLWRKPKRTNKQRDPIDLKNS